MPVDKPRVRYEKLGQVAYITLDRPEALNAMDLQMHEELKVIWDDFESDEKIRLGVLSGTGEKAFCVGQDLKELVTLQDSGKANLSSFGSKGKPGWPRLTDRFNRVKPLIAKVHGYVLGGGFELALACDIIIAEKNTQFALPEARLGLMAGAGGIFRLAQQMPLKTALGYLMTGRKMSATKALALGLINEVASHEELDTCVNGWVEDILSCAPLSIYAIKEALIKSATLSLEEAFNEQYAWEVKRKNSQDAIEGPQAFVQKRPPVWRGR